MHPQLEQLAEEFLEALDRLHLLADGVAANRWAYRTDPKRWSVAECVAHLNLSSAAYLPLLERAVAEAKAIGGPPPRRHRHNPVGWLLWRTMGPPARLRTRTVAAFVPVSTGPATDLVAEFERRQDAQVALLRAADDLPLGRVMVTSPFNTRVRYNLYSCFAILARHQHRHLWQAEQVWAGRSR
ncbi:MAG: DinB family protein [Gemmatimonadales bacterium]